MNYGLAHAVLSLVATPQHWCCWSNYNWTAPAPHSSVFLYVPDVGPSRDDEILHQNLLSRKCFKGPVTHSFTVTVALIMDVNSADWFAAEVASYRLTSHHTNPEVLSEPREWITQSPSFSTCFYMLLLALWCSCPSDASREHCVSTKADEKEMQRSQKDERLSAPPLWSLLIPSSTRLQHTFHAHAESARRITPRRANRTHAHIQIRITLNTQDRSIRQTSDFSSAYCFFLISFFFFFYSN